MLSQRTEVVRRLMLHSAEKLKGAATAKLYMHMSQLIVVIYAIIISQASRYIYGVQQADPVILGVPASRQLLRPLKTISCVNRSKNNKRFKNP